jgi:hypothetical protein
MNAKVLMLVLGLGGLVVASLWDPARVMNCGGNSAALSKVRSITMVAVNGYLPDHAFSFTSAGEPWRSELAQLSYDHWVPKAHFLVTTAPVTAGARRIIVVCDTPYTNVPERRFFSAPPAHAAGYSDGSSGLISPAEFAALDRSTFVALDALYPPPKK